MHVCRLSGYKQTSPKDDFLLPHLDVLVDNTTQVSVFPFMEGFSKYNQIKMAPRDMEKTTFMTPWGTFIINGSERVIVTQIVRSAGAFFSAEVDKKSGQRLYSGQIIPTRGAWIEFEMGSKDIWYGKLDRSKKIPLTTFIRALGVKSNPEIIDLFVGKDERRPKKVLQFFNNTFGKDESFAEDDAIRQLYDVLRPGEKTSADTARKFIASRLFEVRRYDLANVGRYKINKKLVTE